MKPLAGLRIVDLTVAVAGPLATALLGDLGAEVIRVELPLARTSAQHDVAPPAPGAPDRPCNRISSYNDLNRSKRALTLDLSKDAGRDVLLRLAARSDAVVENMSPRVLPNLRLDYDALRAARPDILLVSMPAFGEGPLRARVAYGPGIDAISGMSHLTGYPDRGPTNPANYYADYNAGVLAALATLCALRHRDRTGEGQHVEVSMLEGELQVLGEALLDYTMNRRVQMRAANAHPSMSPHGVYPCAGDDRWIAVACENDAQWQALCATTGRGELAHGERYADVVSRVRRRSDVDAIVAAWTREREAPDAARTLQAAGVPAEVVQTVAEVLDDPRLAARGFIQRVRHPEVGDVLHARAAFTLSATPAPIDRPAPLFAQDNDYVLRDLLRLSESEIRRLLDERVISYTPLDALM